MAKYKKRKDGRYSTTVTNGYKPDGSPNKVTIYAKTIAELEEKRAQVMIDIHKHVFVKDKSVTFGEYSEIWLRKKKATRETGTWIRYERVLRNQLSPLDEIPLIDITPTQLQDLINGYSDHYETARRIRLTASQIFRSALQDSLIFKDPTAGLEIPKKPDSERRVLSPSELISISEAQFTIREEMYVRLLQNYGLRPEEALSLRPENFRFDSDQLIIDHAMEWIGNSPREKPTKNGRIRVMYLMPEDREFFMQFICGLDTRDPHLFRTTDGSEWITKMSFRRMFDHIREKAKLPDDISSYNFRHTFITDLYYAGVSIKDAQYLAGHSSPTITMQIYTHLDKSRTDVRDQLAAYRSRKGQ